MATQDKAKSANTTTTSTSHSNEQTDAIIYTPPSHQSTSTMPINPSTTASISIREYIYILPYPLPANTPVPYSIHLPDSNPLNLPTTLFEPTSTLVLTSPLKTFVDLRFYHATRPSSPPLPNHSQRHRLEWAFAGSNASHPVPDPHALPNAAPWPNVTYSKWTQFVDSRFPVGSTDIPVDEGHMYPISASPTRTLEHGHMFHASLGRVATHEEMWADPAVTSTSASGRMVCVVLRLRDDARGARGVVVRLGKWCQGVVKVGDGDVCCERWEWVGEGEGDGWKRVARIGDLMVPCGATLREEICAVGGRVRYGEFEWEVEEAWEWE